MQEQDKIYKQLLGVSVYALANQYQAEPAPLIYESIFSGTRYAKVYPTEQHKIRLRFAFECKCIIGYRLFCQRPVSVFCSLDIISKSYRSVTLYLLFNSCRTCIYAFNIISGRELTRENVSFML